MPETVKAFIRGFVSSVVLILSLSACMHERGDLIATSGINIQSAAISFDIEAGQTEWVREVAKRYPDAFVLLGHGLTDPVTGEWTIYPTIGDPVPVREAVEAVHALYPGRRVVLVVCNPDGKVLDGVEDVSYALHNVWVMPDDNDLHFRDIIKPAVVGSIWEFREQ